VTPASAGASGSGTALAAMSISARRTSRAMLGCGVALGPVAGHERAWAAVDAHRADRVSLGMVPG
jgi:hypothetical protein